jgi:uncharacterized membrane protein YqhA
MLSWLLKLRYLAIIVAICGALHAVAFVVLGVIRGFEGYRLLFQGAHANELPGPLIAKSIDAFLLGMVFFVFAIGVIELFAFQQGNDAFDQVPSWMRVKSLSELKFLIWEAILVALVVASVEGLIVSGHDLTWTALILPIALLILAAGLYLAKKAH